MSVYESNSIEKNFNEIKSEMDKLQNILEVKIKYLEDLTKARKIQHFEKLILTNTSINIADSDSYYDNSKKIKINIPKEYTEEINKIYQISKSSDVNVIHFDRWKTGLTFTINEKNKEYLKELEKIIDIIHEMDKEPHENNLVVLEFNKEINDSIFKLLSTVGIQKTYSDYKTSRSRSKSVISYNFPMEIRKQIPLNYNENILEQKSKDLKASINKLFNTEIDKVIKTRKEEEEKKLKTKSLKKQALMLGKYDLDLECEWTDLLEVILNKNKYLRLAHYLEANRSDWTEGHSYAENGLSGFNVESELDQDIVENIVSYMYDNWCMDGRVFRDCTYNYSVLYGMVEDDKLMSDYQYVISNIDKY
jgi:hypothetical protein